LHRAYPLARRRRRAYSYGMAREDCPQCGGSGWKVVEGSATIPAAKVNVPAEAMAEAESSGTNAFAYESGRGGAAGAPRVAVRCECGDTDRATRLLDRARIPERYRQCDIDNFETDVDYPGSSPTELAAWHRSLQQAKLIVQSLARDFPVGGTEHGVLLMGAPGAGKTHLAVGALKEIVSRGHAGLFYDYRELLKEIQDSYNAESQATEMGVLEPVLRADVLLLDDLGASKPSLWVLETVGHILNARYNSNRVTLLTTNFEDAPGPSRDGRASRTNTITEDSLSNRISTRIRSRLYEMCRTIEVRAPDYRREIRHAGPFRA
jgi:DNA replication protein DnaC